MKILTLTGPSCSGKTTLLNELVEKHGFQSIVSHTTRPMRPGEVNGKDYYFVPEDEFDDMKQLNLFIENISFNGYSYGVSLREIMKANESGKTAVLIVEPNGLIQMLKFAEKENYYGRTTDIKSVYISGSTPILLERYLGRLAGEDLAAEGVAKRHAIRINSMMNERNLWHPEPPGVNQGISAKNLTMITIPYIIRLTKLDPENFEDTITKINELEFKND